MTLLSLIRIVFTEIPERTSHCDQSFSGNSSVKVIRIETRTIDSEALPIKKILVQSKRLGETRLSSFRVCYLWPERQRALKMKRWLPLFSVYLYVTVTCGYARLDSSWWAIEHCSCRSSNCRCENKWESHLSWRFEFNFKWKIEGRKWLIRESPQRKMNRIYFMLSTKCKNK